MGRDFFVKRDDLIHPLLSGNKSRKLQTFIDLPSSALTHVYSYGGSQSNAMVAIAALCHNKGWQFEYLTKTVATAAKSQVAGNLHTALQLGMQLHEVAHAAYSEAVEAMRSQADTCEKSLFIPQGGASEHAKPGIERLADEIMQWQRASGYDSIAVVTPSGTGTTASLISRCMPMNQVYTTPSVGDEAYLRQQIEALCEYPENLVILKSRTKHAFGKPAPRYLDIYKALKHAGIEFDLLYAPKMWMMIEQLAELDKPLLYVHSGGVSGNPTMLERYRYKGMV
jgi:1-aminocyclopropane-1-carboxylate deaminase/D-cysteine desulfhydrase-like pyridoxal-dependent ACC family enzyme